jgi:D-tyrosyl-tRNA(Tyr) deacylase
MTIVIVSSTEDKASTNIKNRLLELNQWDCINTFFDHDVYQHAQLSDVYMVTITDKTIIHDGLEQQLNNELQIDPSQIIFISRHRSKSGEPTLSTHPIGNYSEAKFGGKTKTLTPAMPRLMTTLLRTMKQKAIENKLDHEVSYEVTHHGPFMKTPTLFAEVGSTLEEWVKEKPARVVAESVLTVLQNKKYETEYPDDMPVLIGIGGGHYAPRFSTVALKRNVAFGHMIPSYHVKPGHIDKEMLKKTLDATPQVSGVYLDRKALNKSFKKQVETWCEQLGVPLVSSKEFSLLS